MSEPVALIIAALIGVIGTLVTTRFDDVVNLFKKSSRNIAGEWEGESYRVSYGPDVADEPPRIRNEPALMDKYVVSIKQKGDKIEGVMIETDIFTSGVPKSKYIWKGKVVRDYVIYESVSANPDDFLVSTAMLFIQARGQKLNGYFIANSAASSPLRTWVGYAVLTRKNSSIGVGS